MSEPYLSINYEQSEPEPFGNFTTHQPNFTLDVNGIGEPIPITYEQAIALTGIIQNLKGGKIARR